MAINEQPALCRLQTLKVARIDQRGIWLEAGNQLAHLPRREAPLVMPGEFLEVFLFQVVAGELQATCRKPLAQAGEIAFLTVRSIDHHGAFLNWGLAKDLLAPFSLQPERMEVGKSYPVKVELDQQGRPFANASVEECLDRKRPDLHDGVSVTLLIWQFTDLGAKVIVNNRYPGLLYQDELSVGVNVGKQIAGYVKRLREDGKIDVTLRKVGVEAVADAREGIIKALSAQGGSLPLHDQSSPEAIRQRLGMSKKTFKKAVGGLYKDGLVKLTGEKIILKKKPVR